ncbi:MAG: mechanosensitive ion channel [Sinobacteraceae bacterium]|nr:mechanosensitive ion channel [Nevskiaceae bacterium]
MGALQQLPADAEDVVPRDRLNKSALTSVQLAFDFGHAAAVLQSKAATATANQTPPGATPANSAAAGAKPTAGTAKQDGNNSSGNSADNGNSGNSDNSGNSSGAAEAQGEAGELDRVADRLAQRVATLQSQVADIDQRLAHAPAKERETLRAQRAEVAAALDLSREVQGTVEQIERFEENAETATSGAGSGLAAQIADLERSVPEARHGGTRSTPAASGTAGTTGNNAAGSPNANSSANAAAPAANASSASSAATASGSSAPAPAAAPFRPESAGVITLVGKWFSLESNRRQLTDAIKQTDTLVKELDSLRTDVSQDARILARQDLLGSTMDVTQLAQAKQQLDAAVTRFKQLSTLLVPIGEEGISVSNARTILGEWRDSLEARDASVARFLALRLGILLGSVAVVLFISEIWRRATFRYLHDARRRQQFLALRRVAVGIALTLVVLFGLVSEVGSLATYAGLITAGLAVALQNVILAVVAYFFLIGRYGVRVGDHITLAGVTGRVVEIGLVRIYLMELTGPQLRPSGRMVVLSNAVLFQPSALFKQMPGSNYDWHTLTLTLAGTVDVQAAEKHLSAVAESVYEKYRGVIERQHAALQRFIDFETAMPRPEVYARLTSKGLQCTVRYPVEPTQAAVTDQRMLIELREALSRAPELQVVDGPTLDSSENA